MRKGDQYFRYVYWSEEDGLYVGLCPDLFYGGCHGDDPVKVFAELCDVVVEVVTRHELDGKPLPFAKPHPLLQAVAA